MTPHVSLRRTTAADADAVTEVMLTSRAAADIPPSVHPPEDHRRWVGGALLADHEVWVACTVEDGDSVVAVLALSPGWVDQLYVAPAWMGQGVGAQLLDLAKQRHPGGLQLWTFVSNLGAQRFYERHGFVVAEQTDGSGNEEHAPDLRYVWRPSVGSAGG